MKILIITFFGIFFLASFLAIFTRLWKLYNGDSHVKMKIELYDNDTYDNDTLPINSFDICAERLSNNFSFENYQEYRERINSLKLP